MPIIFLLMFLTLIVRGSPVSAASSSATSSASIRFYGTLPKPPSNNGSGNGNGHNRLPQTGEQQTSSISVALGYAILISTGIWYFSGRRGDTE